MTCIRLVALGAAILLLSACGSSPAVQDRYYSLVLAANNSVAEENGSVATAHLIVGPVQLPTYLIQRGLPIQVGPNRIEPANHHFWAEPLDDAIAKVLAQEIAKRASGIDVERESGRFTRQEDCRVRLEFDAFHPTSESQVVTSGRYWVSSGELSNRHDFRLKRTLTVDGYAHAVDVLRGTLDTLAQQIADDVLGLPTCAGTASPRARVPRPG